MSAGASIASTSSAILAPSSSSAAASSGHPYNAGFESTKVQLSRRMTSWSQVREAHTGHAYWYNTILITPDDLETAFDPSKLKIRTTRLAILGMSLSAILDIAAPKDFLKSLQMLVAEFDNVQDDRFDSNNKRPKGGALRAVGVNMGRPKRNTYLGSSELSVGLQEGDATYLMTPNIPYELDYWQVAITACDLVLQVYDRILSFLQPPGSTSSVASLSSATSQPSSSVAAAAAAGETFPPPPALSSSSPFSPTSAAAYSSFEKASGSIGPSSLDSIQKIDSKLTKTLSGMVKDFDALARKLVKNELDSLASA